MSSLVGKAEQVRWLKHRKRAESTACGLWKKAEALLREGKWGPSCQDLGPVDFQFPSCHWQRTQVSSPHNLSFGHVDSYT